CQVTFMSHLCSSGSSLANQPRSNLAVPLRRWQNTEKPILIARPKFTDSTVDFGLRRRIGLPGRKAIESRAQLTELSPREQVAASARIVVKIGTNVIMRADG